MPIATNEQVQAFVNERVRVRAEQIRALVLAMEDDKAVIDDIYAAIEQIRPSAGPWFETARNVVEFANSDGTYDELAKYLRRRKIR